MAKKTTKKTGRIKSRVLGPILAPEDCARAFRLRVQRAYSRQMGPIAADELAFHLTDWAKELRDFWSVFASPTPAATSKKELDWVLWAFLTHAPWHINAAAFILTGAPVTDPFELGAVQGSGKGKREPGGRYPEETTRKTRRRRTAHA